ncbi:hypothetical protein J6590_065141 [Homalodisca vitripennis]|nr:hypothetical protein J6590_065141 [Homalodisca vitripennis]
MATSQRFCLRWNNHQSNLLSVFDQLLHDEAFVDVTLAVEGQFLRAHKMVLSACSPYFQSLFVGHPDRHPIVILKDVPYADMRSLLDFMYRGEVSVDQERLTAFLKVAESLRIKGLTEVNEERRTVNEFHKINGERPTVKTLLPAPREKINFTGSKWSLAEVQQLVVEICSQITREQWSSRVNHVKKVELDYLALEPEIDEISEQIIINLGEDSDTEDENDDSHPESDDEMDDWLLVSTSAPLGEARQAAQCFPPSRPSMPYSTSPLAPVTALARPAQCDLPSIASSLLSTPPSAPPPPNLHRIHPLSHKRVLPPMAANPLLGSALTAPKRKRGRPRKLSGSSNGPNTPGEEDNTEQEMRLHHPNRADSPAMVGPPDLLEVNMGDSDHNPLQNDESGMEADDTDGKLDNSEAEEIEEKPIKQEPTPGTSSHVPVI